MLRSLTSTPQHLLRAPPQLGVGPPAQYFTEQKQDHFDPASSRTWSQAFFVNDTFWRPGSDAPIFLCVGGEGPAPAPAPSIKVKGWGYWLAQYANRSEGFGGYGPRAGQPSVFLANPQLQKSCVMQPFD